MARKPPKVSWGPGFTAEQRKLLDLIVFVGNSAWSRSGQTDALMPVLLRDCADAGLTPDRIGRAMLAVGYDRHAVFQLERWGSKHTTGRVGR